jgi:hypothetical protein
MMRLQPRFIRLLTAASLVALLSATTPASAATEAVVKVSGDKFSKLITFDGPAIGINPFGGTFRQWNIRSWLDRNTKVTTHQLYVTVSYDGDWRFYDAAADDNANDLAVTKIGTKVVYCSAGSCLVSEFVGVDLPEATLVAKAATGLQIKISAKSGDSLVLDVSPAQITAELKAIERYKASNSDTAGAGPVALPPQPFGIQFTDMRPIWGLPGGANVGWITGNSVAARSGLKWADTIFEWNGHAVTSSSDLQDQLVNVDAGAKIPFKVTRGRKTVELMANF